MSLRIYSLLGRILLSIILIGITFSVHASNIACQNFFKSNTDPNQIIQNAFFDMSIYHPYGCAGNVGRVLQKLSAVQDISQFKVLFLLYEHGHTIGIPIKLKIKPRNVRINVDAWNYHAVIFSQNQIIDLHSKPYPLKAQEYFTKHFPEDTGIRRWEKIMLQVFPASEYLSSFLELQEKKSLGVDQAIGAAYLSRKSTEESPIISVADFLLKYKDLLPDSYFSL